MNSNFWAATVVALCFFWSPASAQDISISIDAAPPPLVEDVQPDCPQDGYIWTPGYWAYDPDAGEYYWVDGAWVQPPEVGLLWTPAYWGWDGNAYVFYPGYWGPTVGFYGGINYGHGYWGNGYEGGRWNGNQFAYNLAANRVSRDRVHNTYEDRNGFRSASSGRVSYNGGRGGTSVQPTAEQRQFRQQSHAQPTPQQTAHFQAAAQTRAHAVKAKGAHTAGTNGANPAAKQTASVPNGADEVRAEKHDSHVSSTTAEQPRPQTSTIPQHEQPMQKHETVMPATHEAPAVHEQKPVTHEPAPAMHEQTPAVREHAPATHEAPAAMHSEAHAPAPQAKPQAKPEAHAEPHAQGQGGPAPQEKH